MIIKYGSQTISKKDGELTAKILNNSYLTQGPEVKKFEDNLKKSSLLNTAP